MKTSVLVAAGLLWAGAASAQTVPAAERQALATQLNQLLRDPKKPQQEVTVALAGCRFQQTIRDRQADVETSQPIAVSVSKGNSDWSVNVDNGFFEMKMGFEWSQVTELGYRRADDGPRYFELRVKRRTKNSSLTNEMTLHTTDEAVVKSLVARLERLRRGCGE